MSTTQRLAQALLFAATSIAPPLAAAHGDEDHGPDQTPATAAALPAGSAPQRLPDGCVFVPKAVQHQLGLLTQIA